MIIHEKIKKRRIELNMSQTELAEKIGYSDKSSISKIEKGIGDLSQTKIAQFANALKTTPAYLMGWEQQIENFDLSQVEVLASEISAKVFNLEDEETLELIDTIISLPSEKRLIVKATAEALSKN